MNDALNKKSNSNSLQIQGVFSNEEVDTLLTPEKRDAGRNNSKRTSPYQIKKPKPFPTKRLPNKKKAKLAYGRLFNHKKSDLEIELQMIARYEHWKTKRGKARNKYRQRLLFHMKRAIFHLAPDYAHGWNRWSEDILTLCTSEQRFRILWGSGNCGKSAIYALYLYIKWRVNPTERLVLIASKVQKDSGARVYGYIKKIHAKAPAMKEDVTSEDGAKLVGLFCKMPDPNNPKKKTIDELAGIASLPIKVNAQGVEITIGENLLGRHPKDQLIVSFDEGQQLPGKLRDMQIFLNWLTNENVEFNCWGNPKPVEWHNPESWDLLFRLAAGHLTKKTLKDLEKLADRTFKRTYKDIETELLHLSMMDSPKDDPEEMSNYEILPNGNKQHRLHFLAGKNVIETIAKNTNTNSPGWYAQVLGFPYLILEADSSTQFLTPAIVAPARAYPLLWQTPEHRLRYIMCVDPSTSGHRDPTSISVARMGLMMDNRFGIDFMHGKYCRLVEPVGDNEHFVDTVIRVMLETAKMLRIPLDHIGIETHSNGEVFRYAMNKSIEEGKWGGHNQDKKPWFVNSSAAVTETRLFKSPSSFKPAKELCAEYMSELWLGFKCALICRQVLNPPERALQQMYNRGIKPGKKLKLETKREMTARGVASPNDGDSASFVVRMAYNFGFNLKYITNVKYNNYYDAEFYKGKEKNITQRRLGMVSSILGVNLGVEEKKKKSVHTYTSV